MKLTVAIPAYNEAATIGRLLQRVCECQLPAGIEKEIIVVNDASTDGTETAVKEYMAQHPQVAIRYFKLSQNGGKGAALHKAIAETTGDFFMVQDADLEYDPAEYPLLLAPLLQGTADVVYGSRFTGGRPRRVLYFWHGLGNKVLTMLSNAFTNLYLTDMETCYKMFRTPVIKRLQLREKRFGFEPEVTSKLARLPDIRIYEVGISYHGRTYSQGKKIGWRDGFRAFYCILKYGLFK